MRRRGGKTQFFPWDPRTQIDPFFLKRRLVANGQMDMAHDGRTDGRTSAPPINTVNPSEFGRSRNEANVGSKVRDFARDGVSCRLLLLRVVVLWGWHMLLQNRMLQQQQEQQLVTCQCVVRPFRMSKWWS